MTTCAKEPVRRHVLKKVVSISLRFRRIVSSTRPRYLPAVGQYFFSSYFLSIARTNFLFAIGGRDSSIVCEPGCVLSSCEFGKSIYKNISFIFGASILDVFVHL